MKNSVSYRVSRANVSGLCVLIAGLFLCLPFRSHSQQSVSDSTDYSNANIVLPAISSSPETSLLFGGVAIRQFKPGESQDDTRSSMLMFSAIYTLKNQVSIGLQPSVYLPGESWLVEGMYSFTFFPDSFWGIGRNTLEEDEMKVISRQLFLQQGVLKKVYNHLFMGPQFRWTSTYDIRFEDMEGDIIANPSVTGAEGYRGLGMGVMLRLDDRNRSTTPTSGGLYQISLLHNPSFISSGATYTSYLADGRRYIDVSGNGRSVLGFHGVMQSRTGSPPFMDMAALGGESIMRGYYAGRYRDNHAAQFQTEFRQHVIGRFGFTLFAAAGQVWHSFDDMNLDRTLWSGGGGLRFNLNKKDPINIRMDMAFGRNISGFYFTLGEAF
ncbi:BamA/TamA family outer membrane protein [Balneolaceae bacterium YR4-1]|uniref:BamA/TamA family outer membrane protein n=1 Tax=Halalkalibaculum roseum TaxID=2709311 RepID=A0A6M1SSZ2_9BACT|nr:BamA/TamA family outer membrane protein [Halalkalibaculum roseum]NGP75276.1 BamA/TamA family outer membrane protein [Halalkalibaculum roseum]